MVGTYLRIYIMHNKRHIILCKNADICRQNQWNHIWRGNFLFNYRINKLCNSPFVWICILRKMHFALVALVLSVTAAAATINSVYLLLLLLLVLLGKTVKFERQNTCTSYKRLRQIYIWIRFKYVAGK